MSLEGHFTIAKKSVLFFLVISFLTRVGLLIWNFEDINYSFLKLCHIFFVGFICDLGSLCIFYIPFYLYLLLSRIGWYPTKVYKYIVFSALYFFVFIILSVSLMEFVFWDEFQTRFNFLAIDYLEYPYEIVSYFNEYYGIGWLSLLLLFFTFLIAFFINKKRSVSMNSSEMGYNISDTSKIKMSFPLLIVLGFYSTNIHQIMTNTYVNRYNKEIAKSGIYSFFNSLLEVDKPFDEVYKTIDKRKAFSIIKDVYEMDVSKDSLVCTEKSLEPFEGDHQIHSAKPNVILVCMESISASYMGFFGNQKPLTPVLDSIALKGLFFTNMYATGTRTVRGLEAITLSKPPTPGKSLLKRKEGQKTYSIGETLIENKYVSSFFYGGDSYFDNMGSFFSNQQFRIVDRNRGFGEKGTIKTKRIGIKDEVITFENSWGVCDEDLYTKVLEESDNSHRLGKSFFNFVLTGSNHKPYTYPLDKTSVFPEGTADGAVAYSDNAIGQFLKKAKTKPWYNNTIFVFISDHCEDNGNRWMLDIKNYHIPAIILNHPFKSPETIHTLCSQIDILPTVFGALGIEHTSFLFGRDILKLQKSEERAFIGDHSKLALLKRNEVLVLEEDKIANYYRWDSENYSLQKEQMDTKFLEETISYYQVADDLFFNAGNTDD